MTHYPWNQQCRFHDKRACGRSRLYASPLVSHIPRDLGGAGPEKNLINSILLFIPPPQAFPAEHTEAQCLQRDRCKPLFRSWGARSEGFETKSHPRNGRGRSKTGCNVAAQGESQRGGQNSVPSTSPGFALLCFFFFKRSEGRRKEPSARNKGIPRSKCMQLENLKKKPGDSSEHLYGTGSRFLDVGRFAAVSATFPTLPPPHLQPPIPIWALCII